MTKHTFSHYSIAFIMTQIDRPSSAHPEGNMVDDIAIVGYSFKLPQGTDNDLAFWDVLENRRNLRTDWPESRLDTASFLNNKSHKVRNIEGWPKVDDAVV